MGKNAIPGFAGAILPTEKIVNYLLATDHPIGGAKARFFRSLGFSQDRPDVMERALRLHGVGAAAEARESTWG